MNEAQSVSRSKDNNHFLIEGFAEVGQAFDGVVVVGGAGRKAECQIHAMRGGHGGGGGVEVDGLATGDDGAIKDGLSESAAEGEAASCGTYP